MSLATSPESQISREIWLWRLAAVLVTLLALALTVSPSARLGSWAEVRLSHLLVLPVWGIVAWLARRVTARQLPQRDLLLLPVAFLLIGIGLLTIWRIAPFWGTRQLAWFLVGAALLLEVLRSGGVMAWLYRYRYVWLSVGLLLTGLTLILGTNPAGGEARLWLGCCGVYFQPSEALRFLLIAYLASYLADRLTLGRDRLLARPVAAFAPVAIAWGLSAALLVMQRDLGAGTLLLATLALMIYAATGRGVVLLGSLLVGLLAGLLTYQLVDLIRLRVQTWLDPFADPIGSGYQIIQSMLAFASGGLWGRGPGMGEPQRIPVAHSDFVFAAIGEEWGLIGSLGIMTLVAILVARGLRSALLARTPFRALLTAGIAFALALQSILIIGGVTRLLPLTGVTLPFVSYGGTSLVTSMLGLGVMLKISGDRGETPWIEVERLQTLFAAAWVGLALMIGWWSLVRSSELLARSDNPRRAIEARYSKRGSILDRNGVVLAESVGQLGDYARVYPLGPVTSVIGYDSGPFGQSGLEASMDGYLRGDLGHDPLRVAGSRLLQSVPPPGVELHLTLDADLQRLGAQALQGSRGGMVILDAASGEILAMVTSPTFDPNLLAELWSTLRTDEGAPLMNRPVQARYQPGMVLAPFLLAWSEQNDLDLALADFQPPPLPGYDWECATTPRDLAQALRTSCPLAFAAVGEQLGLAELERMLSFFGLGGAPELRLQAPEFGPVELGAAAGLESVGQGELTLSPLTLTRAFSVLMHPFEQPGLRLVRSAGGQRLPALDAAVMPEEREVQELLWGVLDRAGNDWVDYAAEAFLGGESLAWYLAASGEGKTLVVALEGAHTQQVRELGRSFLDHWSGQS